MRPSRPIRWLRNELVSRHPRVWYKLFWLFATVDALGVEFWYKGDITIWLWPWRRQGGKKYISVLSEAGFDSLKEIDQFWQEMEDASHTWRTLC